tara:strand:+ start:1750 stop:2016 length:267 start_codon:yes stop_codon:yes gene_type:complete
MTNKLTWEEQFDQEVEVDKSMGGTLHNHKWIKQFISTKLTEQRTEQRKELIEIIKTPMSTEFQDPEEECADYSIEDFRARLINLIKQD